MIVDLLAALDEKDRTVDRLRHQLEQIKERLYGRRSEKMTERQWLFEYAGLLSALEASAGEDGEPAPEEQEGEEAEPVSTEVRRKRNGTSRRQVASNLPVERVEHTLSEEECRCAECGGPLRRMGEEVTRQIDYIPASFYIREHVRVKYSCPRCQGNVVVAKMPSPPIEKGLPGAGLLAKDRQNPFPQKCIVGRYGHGPLSCYQDLQECPMQSVTAAEIDRSLRPVLKPVHQDFHFFQSTLPLENGYFLSVLYRHFATSFRFRTGSTRPSPSSAAPA